MNITLYSITVLVINLLAILIFIRQSNRAMESMITTMCLSTSFGLIIGFITWIHFYEQPLIATLISIAIGSIIGSIIGTKFGHNTQIEGLFSGLMASMMAVMLIMMFNVADGLFLLMVGLAFLSGITLLSIARSHKLNYRLLLLSCIVMTLIFLYFPSELDRQHSPIDYHQIRH
ncbi:hypothetical protein E3U55_08260 [Filobacillus milosensis]|uniref:DUF4203 domain-containing protein n=1 Tax=Filobacillus milosensis TaxID=94137 RepID=A0A4Y8IKZ3_9BACI|nr:hypothetical protein [Filobacillus milosensis]TFB21806.1 hypothetical protein E3U55_08260 [Filobacillus milosensis]